MKQLPDKLLDIASKARLNGFYKDFEQHFAVFLERSDTLVVTFDNKKSTSLEGPRYPWAYKFIEKLGASHLGIMTKRRNDWFRQTDLLDFFDELTDTDFFDQFSKVIFYGSSMGGYGAASFSAAAFGSHVILYSPQTTLFKQITPWETRYERAYKRGNWDDPRYRDGAASLKLASRVDVFVDPYFEVDWRHADRLDRRNTHYHFLPFQGHQVPEILMSLKGFQPFLMNLMNDVENTHSFSDVYRGRRDVQDYVRNLANAAFDKGQAVRADIIMEAASQINPTWRFPKFKRMATEKLEETMLLSL